MLQDIIPDSILDLPHFDELTDTSEKMDLFHKMKPNIKNKYLSEVAKLLFYEYLTKDPELWPTQQETDKVNEEVSENCSIIKKKIDEEKEQIEALLEIAEDGHSLLQKNIEDLEEKYLETEQKVKRAESAKRQYEEKMSDLGNCFPCNKSEEEIKLLMKEKINRLDVEIEKQRTALEAMSNVIQNNKDLVQTMTKRIEEEKLQKQEKIKNYQAKNCLALEETANLKQLLQELQKLSGIEECPAEFNKIKIKFINPAQTESQLYLTMTLSQDTGGQIRLSHAEVNISTLHCSDLIGEAVRTNNVKSLITQLRDRWNAYYPIMTEIENVSEHHAVDWIQDESLVRILVGKGGTVMFTLRMPPGYPFAGEITVANTSGLPANLPLEDALPPCGTKRLKDWVDFLEEKFGKP